jgi:hypothetical protein
MPDFVRSYLLLILLPMLHAQSPPEFDGAAAARFANLALECVHREYPTKIAHLLNSPSDVKAARELTPVFYGCYDWHSCVHAYWLLARLARTFPAASFTSRGRAAFESFSQKNIAGEIAYLEGPGRASFERPYGLAWLLQLGAELREWDDPQAQKWSAALRPLEQTVAARLRQWLPKLSHPVRSGEHSQTAFALGLTLDWARGLGDHSFQELVSNKVREFFLADRDCPLSYEPSGEDFLSPCLAEADVVRRILEPPEFAQWLSRFLPKLPINGSGDWLIPGVVTDPSDARLVHLDGLNLSRAWMLAGIASSLPDGDRRIGALRATGTLHRKSGLAAVTGQHYEGGHWLGSFAVYLVTERGIRK